MSLLYTQRHDLAEAFFTQVLECEPRFHRHVSKPWAMGECLVQLAAEHGPPLLVFADVIVETSAEMDVRMDLTCGISTLAFSELWSRWQLDELRPAHSLHPIFPLTDEIPLHIYDEPSRRAAAEQTIATLRKSWDSTTELFSIEALFARLKELRLNKEEAVFALEREVALHASLQDYAQALSVFDKHLWPAVASPEQGGERMVTENWKRLRKVIAETQDVAP